MSSRCRFKIYIPSTGQVYPAKRINFDTVSGDVYSADVILSNGEIREFGADEIRIIQSTRRRDSNKEEIFEGYHVQYDEGREGVVEWCDDYCTYIISDYEYLEECKLLDVCSYKLRITRRY